MFVFFFFEQDIVDLIEQALQGNETLMAGNIQKDYAYDYYLPQGCAKLGFPPKTAIEVKKRLVPGILSILINDAKNIQATRDFNKFVIIYEEGIVNQNWVSKELEQFVSFLSIEELKTITENAGVISRPKDWRGERDLRIGKLRKEIKEGQNTLFVGAGLSGSLGVPSWEKLLQSLTNRVKKKVENYPNYQSLKKDSFGSYLITARYINESAERNKLSLVAEIRKRLYKRTRLHSGFMDAVLELLKLNPIGEVITYNYDTLLEQRMTEERIRNTPVDGQNRRVKNMLPVMHVHGVIHPEDTDFDKNVVLSEDEYHRLYRDSYHWANVAQLYALTHTTCIFVGLSMADPSLRRLLDIAYRQGSGDIDHFAFLIWEEFKCHKETEEVLSQMGVCVIWCEDREDVPRQIMRVVPSRLA